MKNRIYISLPISGRDIEDVESAIKSAAAQIEKHGFKAVSPLEVSPDPESSYAVHIGRGITELLECDAALVLSGWVESKGCALEMEAARIYDKKILTNYGMLDYYAKEVEDERHPKS